MLDLLTEHVNVERLWGNEWTKLQCAYKRMALGEATGDRPLRDGAAAAELPLAYNELPAHSYPA